ncbi:hypothetical protein GCM10009813_24150 [Brevibacterium marinum]
MASKLDQQMRDRDQRQAKEVDLFELLMSMQYDISPDNARAIPTACDMERLVLDLVRHRQTIETCRRPERADDLWAAQSKPT